MTALAQPAIVIREAVATDANLIYSSWLRSYWNSTAIGLGVEYQVYQAGQRARIDRLLRTHGALVACSPEAPDTIMGWACIDGDHVAVHYAYTRQIYRRAGVARSLLVLDGILPRYATHMTPAFSRGFPSVQYNPYLLEQP